MVTGAVPTTETLLRELAPTVLAALTRRTGDFASAEDAVQEALLAAATSWPREGRPDNPRGWLVRVASRRWMDADRSDTARRAREDRVAVEADAVVDPFAFSERDDALLLLFLCCHPALTSPSAIALTLRAVGGLTTAEIANAFLVPESTMAQRISRAKRTIAEAGASFELPKDAWPARLPSVLHVLYLMFNEGYASSVGAQLVRTDLANEAIRLARDVVQVLPEDPEVEGLLALMLLTDARRPARTTEAGDLVPLDEQDRSLWLRERIEEGVALVSAAMARGRVGPYQLQAAIAALHDEAPDTDTTDWPQILALYTMLERMTDNPMVALNRAIALAMVRGPAAGLEALGALEADGRLATSHRLEAVRAHLYERTGAREEAVTAYHRAAERTASEPERRYLMERAARLSGSGPPAGRSQ